MANIDIRQALLKTDIKQWKVAELLRVSESQFSRMLRRELPEEKKMEIMAIIDELAARRQGGDAMNEPIFECANIPVAVASKALKVDCQTVRLLLQSGAVNWGIAYHRTPKSRQYSYLIYPKKFYEETGFLYKGGTSE